MLTAELVEARARGGRLQLARLDAGRRATALALAEQTLATFASCVGQDRDALEAALGALPAPARDRRLALGLAKLVEDRASFEGGAGEDAPALRQALFSEAARARREGRFDRAALIAELAAARGSTPDRVERELYGDLRGAERLIGVEAETPEALVCRWERAQVQAVLLRATRIEIELVADPHEARALFRRLKFLRLLWSLERAGAEAWRLTVDGPLSLFGSVTRYGLELAMIVPLLDDARRYSLRAELRWGKARAPLSFEVEGGSGDARAPEAALPDELRALVERLPAHGFSARVATELLELPGLGVVVPDLVLERADGARAFVEVLGHWSRAAVWRRVELVEAGLATPLVFCVSERLRVSEEALPEEAPGCLYVYKGVMSPKALAERAARVARRP